MGKTVQKSLLELALIIDATTKLGQRVQGSANSVTITGATNATPIVITAPNHGLVTGQQVFISGITGNTAANNTSSAPSWYANVLTSSTFSIYSDSGLTTGVAGNGTFGGTTPIMIGALVGTVDGDKFKRQRLMDIYNKARMTLVNAVLTVMPANERSKAIAGTVLRPITIQFTSGVASLPAGFIRAMYLKKISSGLEVPIISEEEGIRCFNDESSTNPFCMQIGSSLKAPYASTNIPDGSDYLLSYYGIADFTIFTDVTGGTVEETINENYIPLLHELGQAIANEQGSQEINALAEALIRRKAA